MSKWYSIGFVGACIVVSALPIPYTAGFEAGGLPACTETTHMVRCWTAGIKKCTKTAIRCGGTDGGKEKNNCLDCRDDLGSLACTDKDGCYPQKHAIRDDKCK